MSWIAFIKLYCLCWYCWLANHTENVNLSNTKIFWQYYSWLNKPKTVSLWLHLKTIPVNFNLTVSVVPNLLLSVFTKSDRPNFVISPTQSLIRSAFSIRRNLISFQIGRLALSELVNSEVSLFYGWHVWFDLTSIIN